MRSGSLTHSSRRDCVQQLSYQSFCFLQAPQGQERAQQEGDVKEFKETLQISKKLVKKKKETMGALRGSEGQSFRR